MPKENALALQNFSEIGSVRLVLGMATSLPTFARKKTSESGMNLYGENRDNGMDVGKMVLFVLVHKFIA